MNKLNVLYIIWSLDQGGAERVVIDLAKYSNRNIFNVTVCCLNEKGVYAHELDKFNIAVIPLLKLPKLDPFILYKISKLISFKKIDVVITHLWTSNFWGRIAAYLSGVKVIIATEHTTDENRSWYYHLADKILSKISSKIIAVSSSVKNFHAVRSKISSIKYKVINNGINIEKFNISINRNQKKKELDFESDDFVIGLFGRFVPAKAHEVLLQSLNEVILTYPKVKILFVGSGPTEDLIKKIASDMGLIEHVTFAGFRKDVPELFRILDLFVLTSTREGFPITLLEAMASEVPVIVTNIGGNSDIIQDGENGFIIEPNDVEELSKRIINIIKHPKQVKVITDHAAKTVKRNFTSKIMAQATERLILELYNQNSSVPPKSKLLFIIDNLNPGGSPRQLIELATRLPKDRYDITVCSLDKNNNALASKLEDNGVPVHSLAQHGFFDLKSLISLYTFIKLNTFDIVHTYLFTADTYGRICAILSRTPVVIASMRSVDNWKNHLHKLTDRILSIGTDKIVVNATEIQNFLQNTEKIPLRKIKVIYNGIDENLFCFKVDSNKIKESLGLHSEDLLVGIFARNDPVKDHTTFFHAAKIILENTTNVTFLAMGYGMNSPSMIELLQELGIQNNVILKDHSSEYLNYLSSVDISVISSLIEGCSNVILESMALKIAVVATRVGGNPELVIDNMTGYLFPPKNPAALSTKIIELLQNPSLRKKMGKKGYMRAKEVFSMKQMINETDTLYKNCLIRKKL